MNIAIDLKMMNLVWFQFWLFWIHIKSKLHSKLIKNLTFLGQFKVGLNVNFGFLVFFYEYVMIK